MKVAPHGFGYTTKSSSFVPVVIDEFRKKLLDAIKLDTTRSVTKGIDVGVAAASTRAAFTANPSIPEEAGWTFLINENDPLRQQIIDAIQPLAIHRNMDKPLIPVTYRSQPPNQWDTWINQYLTIKRGRFNEYPKYILIIGSPQSVPLGLQTKLSSIAFVGRLDFDNINEIKNYVEKVIRIEKSDNNFVNKSATFFATDHGINTTGCFDPTHFSRFDVEKELIPNVKSLNFSTGNLIENDAIKTGLKKSVKEDSPGIVFASSWGMCAPNEPLDLQKEFNGAICCQGDPNKSSYKDLLFDAKEITNQEHFLEGGIFIQQSSYGFGTPISSEVLNWITPNDEWKMSKTISAQSFVASLPKKLVYHEHGPLAYIGFLDEMLSYTLAPDEDFALLNRKERVGPISDTIQLILQGAPVGFALRNMKDRFNLLNGSIADLSAGIIKQITEKKDVPDTAIKDITDKFLLRHDSKNYLIFGDPAVSIKWQ